MKKFLVLLVAVLSIFTLTGCKKGEGDVLNIRVWNDEFISRFRDYYPGYVETDEDGNDILEDGTIVKWIQVANDGGAYQEALDTALQNQSKASADDKLDMFLIEADYALKYANDSFALDVENDLGLTSDDLKEQYQYTKDIVTDSTGALRAVSWQATPGLFAYRTDIAESVLGTSDPVAVQAKLSDWTKFNAVAADMKTAGYAMISGYDDAYRAFSNNTDAPWVNEDGEIVIDDQIVEWIKQTKEYSDNGYNNGTSLWSPEWSTDMGPDGTAFGYFFSTWGINFVLSGNSLADSEATAELGNGLFGKYRVIEGPASFYWGGTWIVGAKGTDNEELVADIMKALTCNKEIMTQITLDTQDYTNNMAAMNSIATDSSYGSDFLGGQNHVALFNEAAAEIDMSNISAYDQLLNEGVQTAFKDYFLGTITWEEAWANFESSVTTDYPELTLKEVPADPFE